jgi:hypothetical protein
MFHADGEQAALADSVWIAHRAVSFTPLASVPPC